jgi:hypothetical protein
MSDALTWTIIAIVLGGVAIALAMVAVAQNWNLKKLLGSSRPMHN